MPESRPAGLAAVTRRKLIIGSGKPDKCIAIDRSPDNGSCRNRAVFAERAALARHGVSYFRFEFGHCRYHLPMICVAAVEIPAQLIAKAQYVPESLVAAIGRSDPDGRRDALLFIRC